MSASGWNQLRALSVCGRVRLLLEHLLSITHFSCDDLFLVPVSQNVNRTEDTSDAKVDSSQLS